MNSPVSSPSSLAARRSLWPAGLVVFFIMFISAMATYIGWAVRQDMDLVRADYYEEDLRYDRHMERLRRTAPFRGEIAVAHESASGTLSIRLPAVHRRAGLTGRVHLYRASDAGLDRTFLLVPGVQGTQRLRVGALAAGPWKARVFWEVGGEEYFFEQPLVVGEDRL
ncbi:MAG TPA: FixH family protein [Methylomirabilota bacterium]|nr:FixH family protein [Methylomirabilota bacterium]